MAKIYSKLLVERLSKWAEKHNTLIDNRYGFQKGKSTVDCIFILHANIVWKSRKLGALDKFYCTEKKIPKGKFMLLQFTSGDQI